MQYACFGPFRFIGCDPGVSGNGISDVKTYFRNISCQAVRIVAKDFQGRSDTICFNYFCTPGGFKAVFLQKLHQRSGAVMFFPGPIYAGCRLFADALYFSQFFRVFFDDFKRLVLEVSHEAGGRFGTDSLDEAGF